MSSVVTASVVLLALVVCVEPARAASAKAAAFCDGSRLLLLTFSTKTVQVVTHPKLVECHHADVSPAGDRVVFTAKDVQTQSFSMYVSELPTLDPRRIGAPAGFHREPTFSPDGKRIVFGLLPNTRWIDPGGAHDPSILMEWEIASGTLKELLPRGLCHYAPSFIGATDDLLLTETDCATRWNVATRRAGATHARLLTRGNVRDHHPTASLDGRYYAYVHYAGPAHELRVGRLADSGRSELAAQIRSSKTPQPRWAPNSQKIYWLDGHMLWTVRTDSRSRRPELIPGRYLP